MQVSLFGKRQTYTEGTAVRLNPPELNRKIPRRPLNVERIA